MWKILTAQIREEIYYLFTSHRLFPEERKGCCKGSRGTAELLYIDQHILNESKTRRKNLAVAWVDYKKGIWYGAPNLDNKLPQNVQNITWSHKLYRENHENPERGIDSRRKKLSWSKDLKRYISRRRTITVTIHNNHLKTPQKMRSRVQTSWITRKDQSPNVHGWHQLFAKNEKALETLIHAVRIYSQDLRMEFGIEKCALFVMKSGKRHLTNRMELPNQDKIRTLGVKES